MSQKILAAINSDPGRADEVVHVASELARAFEADMLVVHVREMQRVAALAGAAPGTAPPPLHMESEKEASAVVDGVVTRLREHGLRAQGRVHDRCYGGSTAKELVDIASSYKASLIVMGERGTKVVDLLGGISRKVVHAAPCPVLMVR